MNNGRFFAGSEAHTEARRAGCCVPTDSVDACDEFNLAKARQVVGVLSGMSAFDAQVVLEIACCLVREEALSVVLDSNFRTADEKQISPFSELALGALAGSEA